MGGEQENVCATWMPMWCLNTKHVMGWDENVNPLSGQSKCLENQLFILFQHFAGYYTTLYYVDGQQVQSIGTSPWCIIYDGHHGPSALKTHWKLMLMYYSGVVFSHWRSADIPRIIYPQRPGATAASATQQSHKDLGVFSWRRHDCGAEGKEYGDAPGIVQARKSDGPESTNGTVEKCLEHQSSAKQTSITSRVRATGIQFPINDGMTIPLYGKTFHALIIAHITANNKKGNC